MGFSIGSDEFDSLALGDTPLEALMLGEVELWSAGGGGPVELVPMSWSGGSSGNPGAGVEKELLSYTVAGSGTAWVSMYFSSYSNSPGQSRYMYLYVNNTEVFSERVVGGYTMEQERGWLGELNHGDVLSFRVMFPGRFTAINSWSLDLTPVHPLSFGQAEPHTIPSNSIDVLWEEVVPETFTADILLSWDWDLRGSVSTTYTRWIELRLNGSRVQRWDQQLTSTMNDNLPWTDSGTVSSQALQAGDVLQVRASGSRMAVSGRTIKSWLIGIFSAS